MKNQKRFLTFIYVSSLTLVTAGAIAFISSHGDILNLSADNEKTMNLSVSNGKVEQETLKTRNVSAKTDLGANVSFDYKNCLAVSGKVGTINNNGFYKNHDPINDMISISVASNAGVSNTAVLYYGKTSSYMPDSYNLEDYASGYSLSLNGANYFKIVATSAEGLTIDSISVTYGCDTKNTGVLAYDKNNTKDISNRFTFEYSDDSYGFKYTTDNESEYRNATHVYVPDYYEGSNGIKNVTRLESNIVGEDAYNGVFSDCSLLEELYIPETITTFGRNLFVTSKIEEFTMPLELTSFDDCPVPLTELKILNINSRNAQYVGENDNYPDGAIAKDTASQLTTINVSYDVDYLPNVVRNFPTGLRINYEGTMDEWWELDGADAWWEFSGVIMCSDGDANI